MTISLLPPPVAEPATAAMRGAYVEAAAVLDEVVDARTHDLGDADLVALLDEVERVGRLADAARVRLAAEVVVRCENPRGIEPLCREHGCRNPNDLLTRATGIASREAARRMRLGRNIVETRDVLGTAPARYPDVARALRCGRLGVDAAEQITSALDPAFSCSEPEAIGVAERALVASATGVATEETAGTPNAGVRFAADHIRAQSAVWRARLDPDGAAPDEATRTGHSSLGFGRLRDGFYPLRGAVTPDLRGVMDALFNCYLSARSRPAFPDATGADCGEAGTSDGGEAGHVRSAGATAAGHDRIDDMRTTDEKRADILHGLLDWAARHPETPTMAGSAPTVLVHVNAADLDAGIGVGWVDGIEAAVSLTSVRQLMCNDGFETALVDRDGTWRPGGQNRAARPIGREMNNGRPRQAGRAG